MAAVRSLLGRPGRQTCLLVCDVQERVRTRAAHLNALTRPVPPSGMISNYDHVINTASKMMRAAQIFRMPVLATEQYPQGLGPTVEPLARLLASTPNSLVRPKTAFPMTANGLLQDMLKHVTGQDAGMNRTDFLLCGIESHICVMQTGLNLLEMGAGVHIAQDGVSSCNPGEVFVALQTLRTAGASIGTSESMLFQLLQDAKSPHFKHISMLIEKERTAAAVDALCRVPAPSS